jgi:hypothetical protein
MRKISLVSLSALAAICLPVLAAAQSGTKAATSGIDLLDAAIRFPGSYSQTCDVNLSKAPAPIVAFRLSLHGEAYLSEKTLDTLESNRAEVLGAVKKKLQAIDLLGKPTEQKLDPNIKEDEADSEPRGYDPAVYSILLLDVISQLNGVEVFADLLAFEEKFHTALLKAEKDPTVAPPTVDGLDSANLAMEGLFEDAKGQPLDFDKLTETQRRVFERRDRVFKTQAAHRDILSVLVRGMRREGFEPMLQSPLEKEYGKLLVEHWGEDEELKKYKKTEDIPEDERENIKYDPIHKVAYQVWSGVTIPYTEEKRSMIRQLAEAFVKSKDKPVAP